MKFDGLIPVIQCQHIEKTLAFYQQALRYIVISKTQDDTGLQWAYIKSDNTALMLQKNSNKETTLSGSHILLHYFTADVAAQHRFMAAKGVSVGQIEDTAYHIRQFLVIDPEGNKIVIGQDIKNNLS